MQVHAVFESLAQDIPSIKCALLNGSKSSHEEAAWLATGSPDGQEPTLLSLFPSALAANPALAPLAYPAPSDTSVAGAGATACVKLAEGIQGELAVEEVAQWQCGVRVAVATPGRLVQHMHVLGSTWLQDLEFLVRHSKLVLLIRSACGRLALCYRRNLEFRALHRCT